ncbi:MAG: hypothetical protein IJB86_11080 [Clostridia bacterium]|nr:hypothetical protein [Clostridia bacterium]
MGAMLVGLATGFVAVCFAIAWKIIYMTAIFIDAKRHKMSVSLWILAALLFDLLSLPFYIYAHIKVAKNLDGEIFDDKKFAKRMFGVMLVGYLILIIISTILTTLT